MDHDCKEFTNAYLIYTQSNKLKQIHHSFQTFQGNLIIKVTYYNNVFSPRRTLPILERNMQQN